MIKIFDTTLRDGEQSPGFAMHPRDKLLMAKQLEKLGVDVIEAGFPIASVEDFEAVKLISENCSEVEVCGFARCHDKDIQAAIEATRNAHKPRIHIFIATSDIHLKHKLKISRVQAIEKALVGVKMARAFTPRVEFTPEDATRTDREFLVEILTAVIEAGVDTVNIADTVGYMTPSEYGDLIKFLRENVVGIDQVVISTHCHNDLGMAVANSLAGVLQGAGQVECTINGIGERAGNASLEEIVMALKTRQDFFHELTHIDTTQLIQSSLLLSRITGQMVQVNKAIVGKNAFAHGAGIHQHGVIAERSTYEIMKPEEIGLSSTTIYLSKHSGRHGLVYRLKELGINLAEDRLDQFFIDFKKLADKKKFITDQDLIVLSTENLTKKKYELIDLQMTNQVDQLLKISGHIRNGDESLTFHNEGEDLMTAIYKGIEKEIGLTGELTSLNIQTQICHHEITQMAYLTWGEEKGVIWEGYGVDAEIALAVGYAFVDMLNMRDSTFRPI